MVWDDVLQWRLAMVVAGAALGFLLPVSRRGDE